MATYLYDDLSGTIIPDTSEIQTEVQQEWRSTLGQQLAVTPNTPQGTAITSDTLARESTAQNNAAVANQINRNLSGGIFLDAIGALMNSPRPEGTYSIIPLVTLAGEPGTIIPAGTTGQDTNDNIFESVSEVTLDEEGNTQVDFQALQVGPIAVAIGAFTQIVEGPLGLETIDNIFASVPGTNEYKDNPYRSFQRETLANQGSSTAGAAMGQIAKVPGFWSQSFRENTDSTTEIIDGVTMLPKSIYSCVSGGTDFNVAMALNEKKGGGSAYNNGPGIHVSVPITDPDSGQVVDVLFDRPNLIPVLVAVTVVMDIAVPDPVKAVKQAILDYANGLIFNQPGFKVGVTISSFALASAINDEVPSIFVKNIFIGLASDPPPTTSTPIPIAIFEMATITESSISVTVDPS